MCFAELKASVVMTAMNREARYRQILSLVVRSLILFFSFSFFNFTFQGLL